MTTFLLSKILLLQLLFIILLFPKKHFADVTHLTEKDRDCAADIFLMAKQLSDADPKAKSFRLINNNGASVGQSVFHIHVHFCAGKEFPF